MIERSTTAGRLTLRLVVPLRPLTVWQALTARDHLARWWGEQVRLEPRLGGRFVERRRIEREGGGRDAVTTGTVIAWDPPGELAMSWSDDDWPAATELRIALKGVDEGCRITLDHRGWQRLPQAGRAELIEAHADAWTRRLDDLARYLAGN